MIQTSTSFNNNPIYISKEDEILESERARSEDSTVSPVKGKNLPLHKFYNVMSNLILI